MASPRQSAAAPGFPDGDSQLGDGHRNYTEGNPVRTGLVVSRATGGRPRTVGSAPPAGTGAHFDSSPISMSHNAFLHLTFVHAAFYGSVSSLRSPCCIWQPKKARRALKMCWTDTTHRRSRAWIKPKARSSTRLERPVSTKTISIGLAWRCGNAW